MSDFDTAISLPSVTENVPSVPSQLLGTFHEYDSQIEVPEIAGTRIVKCLYKTNTATGKKVRESAYTRIPAHLNVSGVKSMIDELAPYIVNWLESVEDSLIKDEHKKGLEFVYTDGLCISKLINYLELTDQGSRLSGQMITDWFNTEVEYSLSVLFADKLGVTVDSNDSKLVKIITAYKDMFVSLASGKTQLKAENCAALITALELIIAASDTDPVPLTSRLLLKLEVMKEKDSDVLVAL